jgi:hypothetical protein
MCSFKNATVKIMSGNFQKYTKIKYLLKMYVPEKCLSFINIRIKIAINVCEYV